MWMTGKTLKLDSFLPYRLSIASNLVSEVISSAYSKLFGLSIAEWRIIAVIAEANGLTQQETGLLTRMDKVMVSRATVALTQRGLIDRTPNPRDGRSQILSLSKEGRELYQHVVPEALALEASIFGTLDSEQLTRLSDLLGQISQAAARAIIDNN